MTKLHKDIIERAIWTAAQALIVVYYTATSEVGEAPPFGGAIFFSGQVYTF